MNDFITARPSLSPLVAGATTTTITGTLASQFGIPSNLIAIITCLVLALFVTIQVGMPLWERILYYFINAITIFTVSMGINSAGIAATTNFELKQYQERGVQSETQQEKPFFHPWF